MNSKMTPNSQLITTTPKTKTKVNQANDQNRYRITEMEITWMVINRGVGGGEWGIGAGIKYFWQDQNKQGEVKNSTGNGESKELA